MFDNINTNYEDAKFIIGIHNYDEVIEFLESEIGEGNCTDEYYSYLSKAYLWKDNLTESLKYANKSIEINPNYAYGYYRLAYIYYQYEDLDSKEALPYIEKAIRLNADDYQNLCLLVQLHYELGNKKEFNKEFKKLSQIENTSADYYYQFARVCRLTDKPKKAIQYLKMAENYRDKITLNYRLGECSISIFHHKKAIEYINKSLSLKIVPDTIYLKGTCYYETENYEGAVECFKEALKLGYDALSVYNALGFIYHNGLNDDISAKKYFDMAEKLDNLDDRYYEAKGDFLLDKKDYDNAIENYKKLLEFDDKNIETNHAMAYCYLFKQDYKEALKWSNKTILMNRDFTRGYLLKCQCFECMNKFTEAIKIYNKLLEQNPQDLDVSYVYTKLSFCNYKLLQDKAALEFINKAIMLNPHYGYALQMKGYLLLTKNKFDEAIEIFKRSQEIEDDPANYLQIAECYRIKGNFKKAIEYSNKVLIKESENGEAYFIKGNSLLALGKTKEGETILKKAQKCGGIFLEPV